MSNFLSISVLLGEDGPSDPGRTPVVRLLCASFSGNCKRIFDGSEDVGESRILPQDEGSPPILGRKGASSRPYFKVAVLASLPP
jgi:hypothetical protein